MSSSLAPQPGEERIRQLVQRFTHIGNTAMRDLPIYNHALQVDAIGFEATRTGSVVTGRMTIAEALSEQSTDEEDPDKTL